MHFQLSLDLITKKKPGQMHVPVFRFRSFSCLRTKSAKFWSFEGQDYSDCCRFSFGTRIGCGFSTLGAINDMTVELIRCCRYFSREKTAIKRSHSSENYDQYDKRYARSRMVFKSPRIYGSGSGAKDRVSIFQELC